MKCFYNVDNFRLSPWESVKYKNNFFRNYGSTGGQKDLKMSIIHSTTSRFKVLPILRAIIFFLVKWTTYSSNKEKWNHPSDNPFATKHRQGNFPWNSQTLITLIMVCDFTLHTQNLLALVRMPTLLVPILDSARRLHVMNTAEVGCKKLLIKILWNAQPFLWGRGLLLLAYFKFWKAVWTHWICTPTPRKTTTHCPIPSPFCLCEIYTVACRLVFLSKRHPPWHGQNFKNNMTLKFQDIFQGEIYGLLLCRSFSFHLNQWKPN